MDKCVIGFIFSEDKRFVALIEKNKPPWQRGRLNGIGGKIEDGETPLETIVREVKEESDYETSAAQWAHYARMHGKHNDGDGGPFSVDCFATVGNLGEIKSMEHEEIIIVNTDWLHRWQAKMIENLPWLLFLALDHLRDGRPEFAEIVYP
jgi:8-oxo-dGTP diphosphatase